MSDESKGEFGKICVMDINPFNIDDLLECVKNSSSIPTDDLLNTLIWHISGDYKCQSVQFKRISKSDIARNTGFSNNNL